LPWAWARARARAIGSECGVRVDASCRGTSSVKAPEGYCSGFGVVWYGVRREERGRTREGKGRGREGKGEKKAGI